MLEIEHLSFRGMFILNSRESPVINYRSTQTTLTFFLYLIHFKPCPFGVELPNCTFLMELLKIVSLIHAGEDRWAGASAGALSLCYIISSKTKFQRCTVHLAIIGELQVL